MFLERRRLGYERQNDANSLFVTRTWLSHYHQSIGYTVSWPKHFIRQLTWRMPQAAGAAYALKLDEERQGDCVICYFGDGECLHFPKLICQVPRVKVTSTQL
jgi:hypothetical protein